MQNPEETNPKLGGVPDIATEFPSINFVYRQRHTFHIKRDYVSRVANPRLSLTTVIIVCPQADLYTRCCV